MLQYKLEKDELAGLGEDIQKYYDAEGTLKIEGLPDWEKKRNIESEHRKRAEERVADLQNTIAEMQGKLEAAGGKEELEEAKADFAAQLEKIRAEKEANDKATTEMRHKMLKNEAADKFLASKFASHDLIAPQFKERLTVDVADGVEVVRVLGADLKPSAMTMTELQQEFLGREDLKPLVKMQVGSGGDASQGAKTTGGKKLADMTLTEQAKFANADPDGYAAMVR
jgi:hypothetical protein